MSASLGFLLNGADVTTNACSSSRLSAVLRDDLGQTGTKVGCDAGDCGACTVLIDGATACACMVPVAQVSGCTVVTVEGVAAHTRFGAARVGLARVDLAPKLDQWLIVS